MELGSYFVHSGCECQSVLAEYLDSKMLSLTDSFGWWCAPRAVQERQKDEWEQWNKCGHQSWQGAQSHVWCGATRDNHSVRRNYPTLELLASCRTSLNHFSTILGLYVQYMQSRQYFSCFFFIVFSGGNFTWRMETTLIFPSIYSNQKMALTSQKLFRIPDE